MYQFETACPYPEVDPVFRTGSVHEPAAASGDGGPSAPGPVHGPTVRLAGHQQVQPVLPAQGNFPGGPDPDEGGRAAIPGHALLRVAAHKGLAGQTGSPDEPEAGPTPDADHGADRNLQAAPDQPVGTREQGVS